MGKEPAQLHSVEQQYTHSRAMAPYCEDAPDYVNVFLNCERCDLHAMLTKWKPRCGAIAVVSSSRITSSSATPAWKLRSRSRSSPSPRALPPTLGLGTRAVQSQPLWSLDPGPCTNE